MSRSPAYEVITPEGHQIERATERSARKEARKHGAGTKIVRYSSAQDKCGVAFLRVVRRKGREVIVPGSGRGYWC